MLRAVDIVPRGSVLVQARVESYLAKAQQFLKSEFSCRLRDVPDAALDQFIISSFDRNASRGMTGDRDQMQALIPAIFWGARFEEDPQHHAACAEADWPHSGQPMRLIEQVDLYRTTVRSDLDALPRVVRAFEVHFARPDAPGADGPEACLLLMQRAFPARVARMGPDGAAAFIAAASDEARILGLGSVDLSAHVALSLYFGLGFAANPVHIWAAQAYAQAPIDQAASRLALGDGVQGFMARFAQDPDAYAPVREYL